MKYSLEFSWVCTCSNFFCWHSRFIFLSIGYKFLGLRANNKFSSERMQTFIKY